MLTRKIEDYTTIEIPGRNSWEKAKENIWNMFYKGYSQEGKFVIDISNGFKSPGLYTIANSRQKLSEVLNFVEKNHVKERRLFNFHFHNLYFVDVSDDIRNKIKEKVRKEEYSLII